LLISLATLLMESATQKMQREPGQNFVLTRKMLNSNNRSINFIKNYTSKIKLPDFQLHKKNIFRPVQYLSRSKIWIWVENA
jgi:hypothetical protein